MEQRMAACDAAYQYAEPHVVYRKEQQRGGGGHSSSLPGGVRSFRYNKKYHSPPYSRVGS